jgi:DNA repair photolyase
VSNPPNPWLEAQVDWLGEPPLAKLEVFEEQATQVLSKNDSPDVGMAVSLNPYRGCYHGCAYCYARPSHQYLGFGAGTDFDRKIVVKVNAPERLRVELGQRSWQGECITFSGNTDCYQPLEACYALTRQCLAICLEFRNPVHIITKGALVRRDVALLAELARRARCTVTLSIPFAKDEMARKIEPYASLPSARFEALEVLSDAGIGTGINIAPVIPGLNDSDIPELLERAHAAGARRAGLIPVRLPAEVLPVFRERLGEVLPERAAKVETALLQIRGGKWNESAFGARMRGVGPRWQVISTLFDAECRRLGMNAKEPPWATTFRRPSRQGDLFDR